MPKIPSDLRMHLLIFWELKDEIKRIVVQSSRAFSCQTLSQT